MCRAASEANKTHRRNVLRCTETFDRTLFEYQVSNQFRRIGLGRSFYVSRGNHVDVDIVAAQFCGGGLCDSHQTCLSRVVAESTNATAQAVDGTDQDHLAVLLTHKYRSYRPRGLKAPWSEISMTRSQLASRIFARETARATPALHTRMWTD